MIKQNELRVGNYALHKWTTPYKLQTGAEIDNHLMLVPVGITKELLVQCGFYRIDDYHYEINLPKGNTLYVTYGKSSCKCCIGGIMGVIELREIKFLHQLQNRYLDLTGKELKIIEIINGKK